MITKIRLGESSDEESKMLKPIHKTPLLENSTLLEKASFVWELPNC